MGLDIRFACIQGRISFAALLAIDSSGFYLTSQQSSLPSRRASVTSQASILDKAKSPCAILLTLSGRAEVHGDTAGWPAWTACIVSGMTSLSARPAGRFILLLVVLI